LKRSTKVTAIKRYIGILAALAAEFGAVLAPAGSADSGQRNVVLTASAAGQFTTLLKLAKQPVWPARSRARGR
jgi:hypothetical protein